MGVETAGCGGVNQFSISIYVEQGGDGDVKIKPKLTEKKARKGGEKRRRRSASDDDEDYVPSLSDICPPHQRGGR